MSIKKYFSISNISLMGAAAVGSYALIGTYILKRSLPAGACPLASYDKWLYLAMALAIISVVTDGLERKSGV
jgi:hypothetical protein